MVREAESHAADDHTRRLQAEARNKLDNLVYTTEKTLKEHGSQLDDAARKTVEDALAEARTKLESKDPDELNKAAETLSTASHKLAEAMYAKSRAQGAQQGADAGAQQGGPHQDGGAGAAGDGAAGGDGSGPKEDVVDADFKEVK
jgi:molecular chaperone DnaK